MRNIHAFGRGCELDNNVRKLRERSGLGKADLAWMVGVHPNTVLNWERGGEIKSSNLVQLCEVFEVGPEVVLGLEDVPEQAPVAEGAR